MKLASIETIKRITEHPNADKLELATILGYQCVVQKGLYKAGDLIVYIKTDTILPEVEWAETYRKYSPKRVKAVKLRGEWSEGIVVPTSVFPALIGLEDGDDVANIINVQKYEPPVPQDLQAKGYLPLSIPKTDEDRWENYDDAFIGVLESHKIVCLVTKKYDGQSCSFYYDRKTDTFGVLGRSLELKIDAENKYTAHINRYNIREKLIDYCKRHNVSLCIRGESTGQGIQNHESNPDSKLPAAWHMFSVWDIDNRRYIRVGEEHHFLNVAHELDLPAVDVIMHKPITRNDIKRFSNAEDDVVKGIEGVVVEWASQPVTTSADDVKHIEGGSFKIINKLYDSRK